LASFAEHITQSKKNLDFLAKTNLLINDRWDWQVTACYYTAVHLVNAHIAHLTNQHYRSHEQVKNALNPEIQLSPTKIPEDVYKAYIKLETLSRRARYLCHLSGTDIDNQAYFTFDKHLKKSIKNLDVLLLFIKNRHSVTFQSSTIDCIEIKSEKYNFFEYSKIAK
jgi:hypothetical protein